MVEYFSAMLLAMRDVVVEGKLVVYGDFVDNSSNQPKLLSVCTNEELFQEQIRRHQLLQDERKAKWNRLPLLWVFIIVALAVTAFWLQIQGWSDFSGFVLGLGGLLGALSSLKFIEQPTEFEARQLAALQEIKMLLRERGIVR